MAKSITKEELIEKLMAFVKEKGRPPRLTEFGNSSSINRHFG
ncbi:MAG: homing endonuclease associated repeat-containing protein, partial [Enterococcus sp.]